jgi:hypothetical protein
MEELHEYRKRLVKRYADIAKDFEALITQISLDDGNKPDDQRGLSLHRVIAHLRDVEKQVFLPYFERIGNEDFPSLANDGVSIRESERHNGTEPFETIMDEYGELRARGLRLLGKMPTHAWNRIGRHPRLGVRTLQWFVERNLAHAEYHLHQLQSQIGKTRV